MYDDNKGPRIENVQVTAGGGCAGSGEVTTATVWWPQLILTLTPTDASGLTRAKQR